MNRCMQDAGRLLTVAALVLATGLICLGINGLRLYIDETMPPSGHSKYSAQVGWQKKIQSALHHPVISTIDKVVAITCLLFACTFMLMEANPFCPIRCQFLTRN